MLTPMTETDDAIVIEFKVHESDEEKTLQDTVRMALEQIIEKNYDAELLAQGIPEDRIRHYGFAFEGKKVLLESMMQSRIRLVCANKYGVM